MYGIGIVLDRNVGSGNFSRVDAIGALQQLLHHSKSAFNGSASKKELRRYALYLSDRCKTARIPVGFGFCCFSFCPASATSFVFAAERSIELLGERSELRFRGRNRLR